MVRLHDSENMSERPYLSAFSEIHDLWIFAFSERGATTQATWKTDLWPEIEQKGA